MKVDVVGFILMLQKRASHVFLSIGHGHGKGHCHGQGYGFGHSYGQI